MTNDSHLFKTEPKPGRLPLYEGKMIHQFTHQFDLSQMRYWIDQQEGRQAIIGKAKDTNQILDYQDYRLGLRKIARNTDERTVISTIIPKFNFCSESFQVALRFDELHRPYIQYSEMVFLMAIWNSFVLDYALRFRVSATINFFYIYQLPVPRLTEGDPYFQEIVERAARLICTTPEFDELAVEVGLLPLNSPSPGGRVQYGVTDEEERGKLRAELDGIIAHLYQLTEAEFEHILGTFPLVAEEVKAAALAAYRQG